MLRKISIVGLILVSLMVVFEALSRRLNSFDEHVEQAAATGAGPLSLSRPSAANDHPVIITDPTGEETLTFIPPADSKIYLTHSKKGVVCQRRDHGVVILRADDAWCTVTIAPDPTQPSRLLKSALTPHSNADDVQGELDRLNPPAAPLPDELQPST